MRVSVIIPTYNMRNLLFQTLLYLSKQRVPADIEIEVIVVDDGSTDSTNEIIEQFHDEMKKIVYIYRPRDALSCRSRARNLGIMNSSGEIIIFLDSGMLIPSFFIEKVVEMYDSQRNACFIHYMFGELVNFETDDMSVIDGLSPETLPDVAQELLNVPSWVDRRESLFNLTNNDLNRLPAPWVLGWTGALTIPARLVQCVEGFDESFLGWGGEDVDFAYRLYQLGISFIVLRDAFALHLPHSPISLENKTASNFANRGKLHRKTYKFETELLPYYPGLYYNQVLGGFDNLVLSNIFPTYSNELLLKLNDDYLRLASPSLFIGCDNRITIQQLETTHLFVHNKPALEYFQTRFPERTIEYRFGCDTPYPDDFFNVVIVSDFIRMLGTVLQKELIQELHRIAKIIIIIYTADFAGVSSPYVSAVKAIDDHRWATISDLDCVVESLGLNMTVRATLGQYCILTID